MRDNIGGPKASDQKHERFKRTSCRARTYVPQYTAFFLLSKYLTEAFGMVRYGLSTGTRHFGKFGTNSLPVTDTSVSSVATQYRYPTLR